MRQNLLVLIGLSTGALLLSGCGTSAKSSAPTTTTTSSTDLLAKDSSQYKVAYNHMIDLCNQQVPRTNSADSATSTAGWNATAADQQKFDVILQAMAFPSSLSAKVQAVISADVSLESLEGTLSVNTGNTNNYNAIFSTVVTAQATANAANTVLANALGLK